MGPLVGLVATIRAILVAQEVAKVMLKALQVLKVLAEVGQHFPKVGARIADAVADGKFDENDAHALAHELASELELRVKVDGVDVIDERAEELVLEFIALVVSNTIKAKAG